MALLPGPLSAPKHRRCEELFAGFNVRPEYGLSGYRSAACRRRIALNPGPDESAKFLSVTLTGSPPALVDLDEDAIDTSVTTVLPLAKHRKLSFNCTRSIEKVGPFHLKNTKRSTRVD